MVSGSASSSSLGLLAGCAALAVNVKPNLGLDLRGGAQFVFQAEGTEQTPATAENVDKTLERAARPRRRPRCRRVHAGCARARTGSSSSCPASPTTRRPRRPRSDRQTAKLTIHEVVGTAQPDAKPAKKDNQVLPTDQGDTLEVGPTVIAG